MNIYNSFPITTLFLFMTLNSSKDYKQQTSQRYSLYTVKSTQVYSLRNFDRYSHLWNNLLFTPLLHLYYNRDDWIAFSELPFTSALIALPAKQPPRSAVWQHRASCVFGSFKEVLYTLLWVASFTPNGDLPEPFSPQFTVVTWALFLCV